MSHFKGQRQIPKATQPDKVSLWSWTRGSGAKTQSWRKGSYNELRAKFSQPDKTIWDSISMSPVNGETGDMWISQMAQADDQINDTQEVVGSNLTQSKLFNLVLRARFVTYGMADDTTLSQTISSIAKEVNKYKADSTDAKSAYQTMLNNVLALFPNTASGDLLVLAKRFMDDLDRNGDSCLQSQYCFRRTLTMSQRAFDGGGQTLFAGIFDDTDVVFTETMLRAVESIPDFFELPPKVINNSQDAFWLKQPTHSLFNNNKREITLEYLFADEWSDLYYA